MLKLTLKPGEYIDIGPDVRIVFSGGSANNIHLLVDAPREMQVLRSSAGKGRGKSTTKNGEFPRKPKRRLRESSCGRNA